MKFVYKKPSRPFFLERSFLVAGSYCIKVRFLKKVSSMSLSECSLFSLMVSASKEDASTNLEACYSPT